MNVMIPWTRNRMPMTKMNTSTDWNGRPQQREADDDRQDADDRVEHAAPVSPSRVNDVMTSKKPLTKSQAAKKIAIVTIVAPG